MTILREKEGGRETEREPEMCGVGFQTMQWVRKKLLLRDRKMVKLRPAMTRQADEMSNEL